MRIRGIGLGVACALLTACTNSRHVVQYWPNWGTTQIAGIHTGDTVTITVSGLNMLCYGYELGINQLVTAEKPINWADLGKSAASAPAAPASTEPAPSEVPVDSTKTTTKPSVHLPAAASNPPPVFDKAAAEKLVVEYAAETGLAVARAARERGSTAVKRFSELACPESAKSPARALAKSWHNGVSPAIAEFATALETQPHALSTSDWTNRIGALHGSKKQVDSLFIVAERRRAKATAEWSHLHASADSLLIVQPMVEARLDDTIYTHKFTVGPRVDTVMAFFTAQPVGSNKAAMVDTLKLPVHRAMREFISAGVMLSDLDSHDFQSVNVALKTPVHDASGNISKDANGQTLMKDTIVSRFEDVNESTDVTFAPTLVANMLITSFGSVDFGIAAGVAARTINKLSPEYMLGASIGIGDRFTINPMRHWGRVQTLSAEIAEMQKTGGIPDGVKLDSAIRTRMEPKWAVVFGIRL